MNRRPVKDSTNIQEVGFDEKTEVLEICFKNLKVYQYKQVPKSLYDAMLQAQSKGGFLRNYVIPHYTAVKIEET